MINVALAGDHALNLHALSSLLNLSTEIQVTAICNLRMLSRRLDAVFPDVVILDVNFELRPVMEAIRLLKTGRSSPGVIVLGLTRDEEAIGRLLEMGADRYVAKDADPEVLLNNICEMSVGCAGDRQERPAYPAWPVVTDTEYRYFRLAITELSNDVIRQKLNICQSSFERLVMQIYRRFNVRSRDGLAVALFRNRWLVRDDLRSMNGGLTDLR